MSASINRLWKRYPAIARVASVLWLLAIAGIVLVWNVGAIGLIDETEPLFVEAARQMNLTGDWITPYFNNETRFDKPPLIYWLMVAAFKLFGVSEWSARLPSVLSALALTLILFYTMRRVGSGQTEHSKCSPFLTPWLAATMLLLNPNTFFWGRTGYSDMLLNACIGGSLLTFFLGYAQPESRRVQQRWYLTFYILIALAVLTKGPIGILLPGLIIGTFLLYMGNTKSVLQEMQLVWGAGLVAVLSVPWYALVTLANGEAFIDSFFGYHNVERFATVVNRHAGPWYFHILVILVGFLPWSVYLPAAIARLKPLQRRQWRTQPRAQQLGIFALCWFGCILGFFTIATTKYFSYTLPLMPAAAILVALLWTDYSTRADRGWGFLLSATANVALLAALAAAIVYSPHWLGNDPWMPNLGARLQASGLPVLGGVIWGVTAIAAVVVLLRQSRWLWLVNLLGFLTFLVVVLHPMVLIADAERQLPLRQIAQTAVQIERPGEPLIMVGFKKPSLVFYTRRSVTYLPHPADARTYLQSATRSSVLLVAGEKTFAEIGLAPDQYQTIEQGTIYRLVRVRP